MLALTLKLNLDKIRSVISEMKHEYKHDFLIMRSFNLI